MEACGIVREQNKRENSMHVSWWDTYALPPSTSKKRGPTGECLDPKPSLAEQQQNAVAEEQKELEGRRPAKKPR